MVNEQTKKILISSVANAISWVVIFIQWKNFVAVSLLLQIQVLWLIAVSTKRYINNVTNVSLLLIILNSFYNIVLSSIFYGKQFLYCNSVAFRVYTMLLLIILAFEYRFQIIKLYKNISNKEK